jgi:hypothetical protein
VKSPTRVVAYLRASSAEQARRGRSLALQRARIEAHAAARGLELVAVFKDSDASGGSLARRGLRAALEALEDGRASGLLVFKLDRLTRSVRDLRQLLDEYFCERFTLLSVHDHVDTGVPSGQLVVDVLASVAEWERERQPAALEEDTLLRLGRPPLETLGAEGAATVRRARQLRERGLALRKIADTLTKEGFPTAHGGRWAAETVRLLLLRATRRPLRAPPASPTTAEGPTSAVA